jgi:hypothetical protein
MMSKRLRSFVSFGLIAFTIINGEPVFLLVQRAESIAYILFVTNQLHKIKGDEPYVEEVISKMTNQEKERILSSKQTDYVQRYKHVLQKDSDTVLEWSFPKGRKTKSSHENPISVAIREFKEETCFSTKHIKHIYTISYTYSVIGSDNCEYKYILFPCVLDSKKIFNNLNNISKCDIKDFRSIITHKTSETSHVGLFGINALIREKGMNKDLINFIKSNYSSLCSLIFSDAITSSSPFMASINFT